MHTGYVVLNSGRTSAPLSPLVAHQRMFLSGNKPFQWRGASAFLLGMRHSLGENVDPFLDWAQSRNFNVLRVFSNMVIVPEQRGYRRFTLTPTQCQALESKVNARGMYIEWTSGDWQITDGGNPTSHNLHMPLGPNPLEHCNEPFKNGYETPYYLMGRFQASGNYRLTNNIVGNTVYQSIDNVFEYLTNHSERKEEWVRTPHLAEEFWDGWDTIATGGPFKGMRVVLEGIKVPMVEDEPTGAAEFPKGNSRSDVPDDFFDYAACAGLFCAGATFHSDAGIDTLLPGPVQDECAKQFMLGLSSVPWGTPMGVYKRTGSSGLPIEASDDTSLRTYAKVQGDKAVVLAIRPTNGWTLQPANGWRVKEVFGHRGNLALMTR